MNEIAQEQHEISNNVVCATSKASDQPAHTRSLIRAFVSRLNILWVKLLTEHHLEFQNATLLETTCIGSYATKLFETACVFFALKRQ